MVDVNRSRPDHDSVNVMFAGGAGVRDLSGCLLLIRESPFLHAVSLVGPSDVSICWPYKLIIVL